ncbi:hypothetical protein Tco_0373969 [Tanacetum coccineum]
MQVMVASVISILSNLSEESVGSHAPQVILFSAIPAIIPIIPEVPIVLIDPIVAPEVGAVSVVSPTGVLNLVDYSSSSSSDPSKDSFPPVPDLPLVSPFLCSNDLEADSKSEPVEQRPERHESLAAHDAIVSRWKRVGPIPTRRLAWGRVSHHSSDRYSLPDVTLDSSSSSSSSDSSSDTSSGSSSDSLLDSSLVHSSGCDSSGQAHSGPSVRVVSPRLVYLLVLTPRHSEAFRCWRSAPLSTSYRPTISESSLGLSFERSLDSSSPSSRLSRKRCRSPMASVPALPPISRVLSHVCVDLIPSPKRVRDSDYLSDVEVDSKESSEPSRSRRTDATIEACFDFADIIKSRGIDVRVVAETVVRDEIETDTRDVVEIGDDRVTHPGVLDDVQETAQEERVAEGTYETLGNLVQRFHDHIVAILVHHKQIFESVQRFQGYRIARVDLGFTIMTERLSTLEQDNARL